MDSIYAYLAGAIDADGFFTIQVSRPSPSRIDGRRTVYYTPKVGFSEIHPIIPDLLHQTFGGWRGMHTPKNPAHRPWHIWQATNALAADVARHLLPHLRLKRRQAELIIELQERITSYRPKGRSVSEEEATERHRLYVALTQLNKPRNRRVHFDTSTIPPLPSGI